MTQKLIFIGGPPGVGKTTVAKAVLQRLQHAIRVDGDDLWYHMNPWVVNDVTKTMAIKNIQAVLANFLDAEFSYVILSWVLHQQEIVDAILSGLRPREFDLYFITLICDEHELSGRWEHDSRGALNDCAKERLAQCRGLKALKIDTTGKDPSGIAQELLTMIGEIRS